MGRYNEITKYCAILRQNDAGNKWEVNARGKPVLKLYKSEKVYSFIKDFTKFKETSQMSCLSNYKQILRVNGIDLDIIRLEDIIINSLNVEEVLCALEYIVQKEKEQDGYLVYLLNKGVINNLLDRLLVLDK